MGDDISMLKASMNGILIDTKGISFDESVFG